MIKIRVVVPLACAAAATLPARAVAQDVRPAVHAPSSPATPTLTSRPRADSSNRVNPANLTTNQPNPTMAGRSRLTGGGRLVTAHSVVRPQVVLMDSSLADLSWCSSHLSDRRHSLEDRRVARARCGASIRPIPDERAAHTANSDRRSIVLIRLFDADSTPLPFTNLDVRSVSVRIAGTEVHHQLVTNGDSYIAVDLESIEGIRDGLRHARHAAPVEIVLQDERGAELHKVRARIRNRWQAYGTRLFEGDLVGLWVPIGIIATSFERSENGMEFSTLPVGAGLGGRWYPNSSPFYLGLSGIGMYSIYQGDKVEDGEAEAEEQEAGDRITLTSLAAGGLLDVGGMVYLSVTRHIDLAEGVESRWMFGVGAGPELLKMIGAGHR